MFKVTDTYQLRTVFSYHLRLREIKNSLHRLDENQCNYGLTPRQEKRVCALEKEAEEIANILGLYAYHQSDPRGCSLYLVESLEKVDTNYNNGIAII